MTFEGEREIDAVHPGSGVDEDGQMELHETVRIRDREQLQKKDRDREFPKRRRVERPAVQQMSRGGGCYIENESTDSSDEEYFEEEVETRIHQQIRINQLSPTSLSLSNNHRGIRSLRSAPVLRTAVDEVLGVPVPRRARSGSGGLGEDLSHRKIPPSPATVSLIGSGGASPSYSGASMKKKMKYVDRRTRVLSNGSNSKPPSVIQDDIEIEVAEALFDLMKQSHPQSQSFERQEKVERDSTNTADDDLKRLKAERELEKEGRIEKEKFPDNPAQELVRGDGFVDKEKWGHQKRANRHHGLNECVEAKKESKIEIDLMSLPSLPSSPERDALLDIDPKVMTQDKSETTPKDDRLKDGIRIQGEKIGVMNSNQLLSLDLEKHRHDISSVSDNTTQQQQGRTEQKNQSPTVVAFLCWCEWLAWCFSSSGYVPSQRAIFPIDGSARSSMIMQQLIKKSLSSGPTGAATLYAAKPLNLKSKLPTQGSSGKDKSSDDAADFATTSHKSVHQQASHQAPANNLLYGPGFKLPLGHHQTTMMAQLILQDHLNLLLMQQGSFLTSCPFLMLTVQSASQNTSTFSGLSSHKQPQAQQQTTIFQMLPDISWNGTQMAQHKNFPASEGKSDCNNVSAAMGPSKLQFSQCLQSPGQKNTGSSSQRTASTISALASQETEASQNGPGQKSSPACRRNVPSILSARPSQLSELKY
ncbi:hypothetical protein DH2020_001555 [Rehmannia glutinosa]|uniref:Uncharacterized protein n=1 Tax=Rehmannia glutinosa TaxID=99300 RepID=A0ABR0XZP4_REHGL